jgi:biotin synthase
MCYAIPAKIISFNRDQDRGRNTAVVDYFGEQRNIIFDDTDDIAIGDYVYAQGGILVRKIPQDEAEEILKSWRSVFFELKKTDEALSQINTDELPPNVLGILQKINLRKSLKKEEMITLFDGITAPNELKVLYEVANNIRQREHGNACCVHGIIEFSNYCHHNCHYCGIRCARESLPRYRMEIDEILAIAKDAVDKHGFKALVLQSGEDLWYDETKLTTIVKEVKRMGTLVFVSLGERDKQLYEALYKAGARAALMRFETANAENFARLRPGTTLENRIDLIKHLKDIGYVLATGFMIGLPGETSTDIVNSISLTRYLAPDMYSFGPLVPTRDTPLANSLLPTKEEVLKTIAISRFVDSNSNILVTTSLETIDETAKREALLAGANSMMINITPENYKKMYAIYDNRAGITQSIDSSIQETVNLLYSLGRAPTDIGISAQLGNQN